MDLRSNRLLVLASKEEGQALVEYALIIGLVALFTISALQALGTNVNALLTGAVGAFGGV
jgi:Flp pilus assembly pilin Flp